MKTIQEHIVLCKGTSTSCFIPFRFAGDIMNPRKVSHIQVKDHIPQVDVGTSDGSGCDFRSDKGLVGSIMRAQQMAVCGGDSSIRPEPLQVQVVTSLHRYRKVPQQAGGYLLYSFTGKNNFIDLAEPVGIGAWF